MSDVEISIEQNGFEVSYKDPEICAANAKNKTPWKDPEVCFVFKTVDEVVEFVTKLLPKLEPSGDDQTEFSKAFVSLVNKEK